MVWLIFLQSLQADRAGWWLTAWGPFDHQFKTQWLVLPREWKEIGKYFHQRDGASSPSLFHCHLNCNPEASGFPVDSGTSVRFLWNRNSELWGCDSSNQCVFTAASLNSHWHFLHLHANPCKTCCLMRTFRKTRSYVRLSKWPPLGICILQLVS